MSKRQVSNDTCDVCGDSEWHTTVSSGIAPVSYGFCEECYKTGAENIGVVSLWLAMNGGPAQAPEFKLKIVSHINGRYVTWDQIKAYYLANEESILSSFQEEFLLQDPEI